MLCRALLYLTHGSCCAVKDAGSPSWIQRLRLVKMDEAAAHVEDR